MEVSGQLHTPATLPLGYEPPVNIGQEASWSPQPVWTRWRREEIPSLLLTVIEPRSSSP